MYGYSPGFSCHAGSLRLRAVERHLGPAPCWFIRDAVANRLPMHLGVSLGGASAREGRAQLVLRKTGQPDRELAVDHVIAATGYKAAVSRLTFIDEQCGHACLRRGMHPP